VRIVVNLNIINHLVWLKERIIFAVFNVREYGLKKLARVPVRIIRDMVKALLEHVIIARNHIEHVLQLIVFIVHQNVTLVKENKAVIGKAALAVLLPNRLKIKLNANNVVQKRNFIFIIKTIIAKTTLSKISRFFVVNVILGIIIKTDMFINDLMVNILNNQNKVI